MELQYHGGNCLRLTTKKTHLVIDPVSDLTDLKTDVKKAEIVLGTQPQFVSGIDPKTTFLIDIPGEYEFEEISVKGVATQSHAGASGDSSATMYRVAVGDISIVFVGHINEKLSDDQLEALGLTNILVVPVGGNGYTLDATGAAAIVRAIEPKLVIPVYYAEDGLKYEVPADSLEVFTKELGAAVEEAVEKYKVKTLPESLTVQPLEAS